MKKSEKGEYLTQVSDTRQDGELEEVHSKPLVEKKATGMEEAIIVGDKGDDLHRKDGALTMNEEGVSTKVYDKRQDGVLEEVPSKPLVEKKATVTEEAIIVGGKGDDLHRKDGALTMNEKGVLTKNSLDKAEPSDSTVEPLQTPKEEAGSSTKSEEEKRIRGREEFLKRRDDKKILV